MNIRMLTPTALALALAFTGCTNKEAPLTEAQQIQVQREVRGAFDAFYQTCNRLDIPTMVGTLSPSEELRFVDTEGQMYAGREVAKVWSQVNETFATAAYDTVRLEITPLGENLALLLWQGKARITQKDGTVLDFPKVGWTALFVREQDRWMIRRFHESSLPPEITRVTSTQT